MEELPIVIPPVQNQDAAIVIAEANQKRVRILKRRSTAQLQSDLPPPLDDAWDEIYLGRIIYEAPNYRTMNWGNVGGMSPEEMSAYLQSVKNRYDDWCSHMSKNDFESMSLCVDICRGMGIKEAMSRHHIGYNTVLKRLVSGLKEYCRLSGWKVLDR